MQSYGTCHSTDRSLTLRRGSQFSKVPLDLWSLLISSWKSAKLFPDPTEPTRVPVTSEHRPLGPYHSARLLSGGTSGAGDGSGYV